MQVPMLNDGDGDMHDEADWDVGFERWQLGEPSRPTIATTQSNAGSRRRGW